MRQVSVRDLRNHTSSVLRQAESEGPITIAVNQRPIAELTALDPRPQWTSGEKLRRSLNGQQADSQLRRELDLLLDQTTDEL